jgi:hypothetical protein
MQMEAQDIWPGRQSVLISIGTGTPPEGSFDGNLKIIAKALVRIATETERTANDFHARDGSALSKAELYFLFNVPGLESVGLDEWSRADFIRKVTEKYIDRSEMRLHISRCRAKLAEEIEEIAQGKGFRVLTTYLFIIGGQ